MNAFHAQNLDAAIAALEAEPEHKIDLSNYVSPCKTLHCLAGLLVETPHFQALGWKWESNGMGSYQPHVDGFANFEEASVQQFGVPVIERFDYLPVDDQLWTLLFSPYGASPYDKPRQGSKECAMNRLQQFKEEQNADR